MTTFVFDKDKGVLVPKQATKRVNGAYVMPDIKPYQAVGPEYGKMITSRSRHREYLRKHNLTEVGNEKSYFDGKKH